MRSSSVKTDDVADHHYVGYTFAGSAGHRESSLGSLDTCGCHHIPA